MGIHATVIGNLGRDAEIRHTPQGKVVCNFSVGASNARAKDQTTWVRCALWGARGEKLQQYLTKGSRVAAIGSLTTREYEGKTYVELEVNEVELLGERKVEASAAPAPRQQRAPQQRSMVDDYAGADDDIPF